MNAGAERVIEIFFCYAREDKALLVELKKWLHPFERQGVISSWHDRDIQAGKERASEIGQHLAKADVILLLVSPDFMASDYAYGIELQRAMERHEAGEARVVSIILRPTLWDGAPFRKLQVLPTDSKPVTSWPDRDQAFLNIARVFRRLFKSCFSLHQREVLTLYKKDDLIRKIY